MDPLAHSLVGAALAQTDLGRRTRFGAAALVVGANLPDIDALTTFLDSETALCARRGWTHGLLAMVMLPLILTAALILLARLGGRAKERPRAKTLLCLSFLATATHPTLDWLNTYGMRWLMPWDGRWFYGDAVFIVDPWMWLVLGIAVFLGHSSSRAGRFAWALLAATTTALLFSAAPAGLVAAKLLWVAGLVVAIGLRLRRIPRTQTGTRRLAAGALLVTSLYIGMMVFSARFARHHVIEELHRRGIEIRELMVGPVPITPFVRDVVVATPDHYRYGRLELIPTLNLRLEERVLPKPASSPLVTEALGSREVRCFMNWARFPYIEFEEREKSTTLYFLDARYTRTRTRGFGGTQIEITKSGTRPYLP